jgi:hypothetical protein
VAAPAAERVSQCLTEAGETVFRIGSIVERGAGPGSRIRNMAAQWPG